MAIEVFVLTYNLHYYIKENRGQATSDPIATLENKQDFLKKIHCNKMKQMLLLFVCVVGTIAAPRQCKDIFKAAGMSARFNETVAHAIHSITVQGLRLFNDRATEKNSIPTVNHDLKSAQKVLPYAPNDPIEDAFTTEAMNVFDKIMNNLGTANDGLGPNWSPVERIAHNFHMRDLWHQIASVFHLQVLDDPPADITCDCLMDTAENGIEAAVRWVAQHYETGTPITLLGRPIPKLTDADTWSVWKDRLLYYYTPEAILDAAKYLFCATKDF